MKSSFLEKFEEKFYFKTSHYFWHLITGLAGLALVAGVLILLWGLTPSLKPGVSKAKYPEPVAVTANEVLQQITPAKKSEQLTAKAPVTLPGSASTDIVVEETTAIDSTKLAYDASLDSLKTLLPPNKFPWKSRGHWEQ